MNEVLLANLFFIITGSAVLVVGVFVCIACYYLIGIVRMTRTMLKRLETSTELLVDDVKDLRDRIANGTVFGKIIMAILGALTQTKRRRRLSRRKGGATSEE